MSRRRGRGDTLPAIEGAEPITRDEAVLLLHRWSSPTNEQGTELVECSALIDVLCAAHRLMKSWAVAEKLLDGWRPGLPETILDLSVLLRADHGQTNDSATAIRALRQDVDVLEQRQRDRVEAAEHLREAARLLGVRSDLFYSRPAWMLGSYPKSFSYEGAVCGIPNRHVTPEIEGETDEEHHLRRELNNALEQSVGSIREAWPTQRYAQYDRPNGGHGSLDTLAIRMLWDGIPWQIRQRTPNVWEPYAVVADILRWIGYGVDSRLVRSTVVDFRAHDYIEEIMSRKFSADAAAKADD